MFCKIVVLRKFSKFTLKHLCQSLFFNKVADLRPWTLLEKRLCHRCFPVNFAKFPRTPFITEHFWWLILSSFYEIFSLATCINITEFNCVNRKQLNIPESVFGIFGILYCCLLKMLLYP